MLKAFETFAIS